jgi:predicted DNA-binding WGR domain protein
MPQAHSWHTELIEPPCDKFYRFTEIPTSDGTSMVLCRWGRRGTRGQARLVAGSQLWSLRDEKWNKGYDTVLADVTHDVPDVKHEAGKVTDWAWIEQVDVSFTQAAAGRFDAGEARGAAHVVAVVNLARWRPTPGFNDGLYTKLTGGAHVQVGNLLLASATAGQCDRLVDWTPVGDNLDIIDVEWDCGDTDVLTCAAGMLAQQPEASIDADELARTLEAATLVTCHTA